jgi:phosphatidylinositol glycan class K
MLPRRLWALLLLLVLPSPAYPAQHASNWAVIIDTSIFWFNYRHASNALAVYWAVRAGGLPDSQIILMIADNYACNTRNSFRGTVFDNPAHAQQLYENVEVDFHGSEVTVENFLAVLSGRQPPGTPPNRRLGTDSNSNLLVYMTGHGGDGFLKFRDTTDISGPDLADAFAQMRDQGRFNELLFMADTCQGATLFREFRTPGVVAIGSADQGENSYSFQHDETLGVMVSDRFTFTTLEFFKRKHGGSLQDLFSTYSFDKLRSHARWRSSLSRPLSVVPATDFFATTPRSSPFNGSTALRMPVERAERTDPAARSLAAWGSQHDHGAAWLVQY